MLAGAFKLGVVILTLTLQILSFSDRDLLMRYHWGLGIGHCYARNPFESSSTSDEPKDTENDQCADLESDSSSDTESASDVCESDNSELCLDDRDAEGWDDVETSDSDGDLDYPSEEGGWSDSDVETSDSDSDLDHSSEEGSEDDD